MIRRVLIYGGTELTPAIVSFVSELSYAFLEKTDFVLVTGGFSTSKKVKPGLISTDKAILQGYQQYTKKYPDKKTSDRLEVWLPDPELDRNNEQVQRFGNKINEGKVVSFNGKSAQARRLAMVRDVDGIITVSGKKHTALIIELALTINKPVLPLCFTGGDSKKYWKDNEDEVKLRFNINGVIASQLRNYKPAEESIGKMNNLIIELVSIMEQGIKRRCLVLMPFDKSCDWIYEDVLKKAAEQSGYFPIRIDQELNTGVIFIIFDERIKDTDCVLADITQGNHNVMYELGYLRALNIKPILISMKEEKDTDLPFYLKDQKIEYWDEKGDKDYSSIIRRINGHLANEKK
ncbi:MAG: hypothetical protein ABJB11_15070 [Ferruginibacter sp.]